MNDAPLFNRPTEPFNMKNLAEGVISWLGGFDYNADIDVESLTDQKVSIVIHDDETYEPRCLGNWADEGVDIEYAGVFRGEHMVTANGIPVWGYPKTVAAFLIGYDLLD